MIYIYTHLDFDIGKRSCVNCNDIRCCQPQRYEIVRKEHSQNDSISKSKACWSHMGVSKNRGNYPQIIHFNRVFHYFHHPFWGVYHPYWVRSPLRFWAIKTKHWNYITPEESTTNPRHTLPQFNSEFSPEKLPSQKKSTLPTIQKPMLIFRGVTNIRNHRPPIIHLYPWGYVKLPGCNTWKIRI